MVSHEQITLLAKNTSLPFYVYSRASIRARCALIKTAFPADLRIYYSLKANSHQTVVDLIRSEGLLVDVASLGELEVALKAGFSGNEIEFTGPGKTEDELKYAVRHDVEGIVVESAPELEKLDMIARDAGKKISVSVRLNPKTKVNHLGRRVQDAPSQFGVDEETGEEFGRSIKKCQNVKVVGTHTHLQSQILAVDPAIQNLRFALEAASRFSKAAGIKLTSVNLGGGLGIPYAPEQRPVDFSAFAAAVSELVSSAKTRPEFSTAQFGLEFGRFVVGEAGMFVTQVLYTKKSRGRKFVITDGGFTQSQISCGVGQAIKRNLPIEVFQKNPHEHREKVTIAGPSCYGLDIIAEEAELPVLQPGDLIGIQNVGAYGYSFSPFKFLRQREAEEVFI